jgi:FAD/FMN-containing dehydrogenase
MLFARVAVQMNRNGRNSTVQENRMSFGQTLIDKAAEMCGSRYKLAKILDESEGNLGSMARGTRQLTPRVAARLAELVDLDPREAACAAIIAMERDATKRADLERAFHLPAPWTELLQPKP